MIFQTCIVILLMPLVVKGQECPDGRHRCAQPSKCIRPHWMCNGANDCGDGSDELYCGSVDDCGPSSYSCSSGGCFRTRAYCDETDDCADKSDEIFCNIHHSTLCPRGMIKCRDNTRCYPEKFKCDGYINCRGGSDEYNCINSTITTSCTKDFVSCARSSKCIYPKWVCDGANDCHDLIGDGSDELYCRTVVDCGPSSYSCSSDGCFSNKAYCDETDDCADKSDEIFCNIHHSTLCPRGMIKCRDNTRCYPEKFKCDGYINCRDGSDEYNCITSSTTTITSTTKPTDLHGAVYKGIQWLLNQRKGGSTDNRWGPQLHRIATALFLAEPGFFTPGNKTGEEMIYELTIKLLSQLNGNSSLSSGELALYVQALLVTCIDPREFYGWNLVSELRRKVEASQHINPFIILALCNADARMTPGDVQKVSEAYESTPRPFWTDTQAIAALAMQCLFSKSTALNVDERVVKDMQDELKKRQFRNGSVENLITTAMVVQATLGNDSYNDYFNMTGALSVLINNQKSSGSWGSIQKDYYILPALSMQSLVNVSSKHCMKSPTNEEDALQSLQEARGEKFVVLYSVWFGKDVDLGQTWRLRMPTARNISFYDVIETVKKLDSKHNVAYNVVENKPYVNSLFGKEDDPELGLFWFTYVRSTLTNDAPKRIDTSPVFVKVKPNQELILWYKTGNWEGNSTQDES